MIHPCIVPYALSVAHTFKRHNSEMLIGWCVDQQAAPAEERGALFIGEGAQEHDLSCGVGVV